MAINKIYTPEEIDVLMNRLSVDMPNLTSLEQMDLAYIVIEFAAKIEAFWDKHDKLDKLSINFDV